MKDCSVSRDDMRAAASRLDSVVMQTTLLENPDVNAMLGGRLLVKAENLQRTGAFKIRGAYHRILGLTAKERECVAATCSSGNHASGLARAAQIFGSSAVILMPSDAPTAKMAAVGELGAEVVTCERDMQLSADPDARVMAGTSRIEVPPSALVRVLAFAGTAALGILDDTGEALDVARVPCGGGGPTASTTALKAETSPSSRSLPLSQVFVMTSSRRLKPGIASPTRKAVEPSAMRS